MMYQGIEKVVATLIENKAYVATRYVSDKLVIRATRKLYKRKIVQGNIEIFLTIGHPNYLERDFIKLCKKAKESFPIKKIQLKFPPKKK